jgi:nucleotide-binding universal stress UspA family protein
VGRSYVPILDTSERGLTKGGEGYRLLVPIANPRIESPLVDLACTFASNKEDATVHAVHVVQTPKGVPIAPNSIQRRRIAEESGKLMADLEETAAGYDVTFETSTVVTPRSFEEVFDIARRMEPDLVLMGWAENRLWSDARAERPLAELTNQLPCDFLIVADRGLDTSRILLPTAGGPDSDLSAEFTRALQQTTGADVSLLHVVDGPDEREAGERFIREWALDHDLDDVEIILDESGDVEDAIKRAAADHTLMLLGATERGLLSRLLTETLHFDVVHEVDCSVILSERASKRPLLERLFG